MAGAGLACAGRCGVRARVCVPSFSKEESVLGLRVRHEWGPALWRRMRVLLALLALLILTPPPAERPHLFWECVTATATCAGRWKEKNVKQRQIATLCQVTQASLPLCKRLRYDAAHALRAGDSVAPTAACPRPRRVRRSYPCRCARACRCGGPRRCHRPRPAPPWCPAPKARSGPSVGPGRCPPSAPVVSGRDRGCVRSCGRSRGAIRRGAPASSTITASQTLRSSIFLSSTPNFNAQPPTESSLSFSTTTKPQPQPP